MSGGPTALHNTLTFLLEHYTIKEVIAGLSRVCLTKAEKADSNENVNKWTGYAKTLREDCLNGFSGDTP
jgi:hypothetical protein